MGAKVLKLPFKPFTFDEVHEITGCPPKVMDLWGQTILTPKFGDDKFTVGFDYVQTFAIHVGHYYLREGAPMNVATAVVRYLASGHMDTINANIDRGFVVAVPRELAGEGPSGMLRPDPRSTADQRVRLDKIRQEFRHNLGKLFPDSLRN